MKKTNPKLDRVLQLLRVFQLRNMINNLTYLPRWVILVLDIGVIAIAGFIGNLILKGLHIEPILSFDHHFLYVVTPFLFINLFFFWVFSTYSGIVRHSTFIDAVKLFSAQLTTLLSMLLINYLYEFSIGHKLFLNTRFLIIFLLSVMGLIVYRILVKNVYAYFKSDHHNNNNKETVLVYGVQEHAVAIANALSAERPSRFKIIGFIDPSKNSALHTKKKRLLNLPIYYIKSTVVKLLQIKRATGLILTDTFVNNNQKIVLVDECLQNGIKVYNAPGVMDWKNEKELSSKVRSIQIDDLLNRKPIVLDTLGISAQLFGKTVLITGAAGSIGSEIVRQVCSYRPKRLVLVDQAESPLHHLQLEISSNNKVVEVHYLVGDIRDRVVMEHLYIEHQPQIIYHAAAYKHVPMMEQNPAQAVLTNVMGTKIIADLAIKYQVEKFVMVSTDKAVNPSNVMGASKRIAEIYVQTLCYSLQNKGTFQPKFITTRFGNVLGSNGSVVPLFAKQIEAGGPITITHPEIIRYFMTIKEACQLVLEAGMMGKGGEIFLFDMGQPVKIIDLAHKMILMSGLVPDKDIAIQIIGLRPGEKLYEELLTSCSKTLPTYHSKIMVATEVTENFEAINAAIAELIQKAYQADKEEIVAQMKEIVPEFISLNSEYAHLDAFKKTAS